MHPCKHPLGGAVILVVLLMFVGAVSLSQGARIVPVGEVVDILRGVPVADDFSTAVVLERVPRLMFCLLAGAALGVSGLLMQMVTRNPIADPSILGVNSGASLAVVCGIAFLGITTAPQYLVLATLGAAVTTFLVFGIGSVGGTTPLKLALAGTAVSVALSSLVSIIVMPRSNVMDTFRFWQMGSVSGASWESLAILWPVCVVGMLLSLACSSALEVLALGDEAAVGLGAKPGAPGGLCCRSTPVRCDHGACWPHRLCRSHGPARGEACLERRHALAARALGAGRCARAYTIRCHWQDCPST